MDWKSEQETIIMEYFRDLFPDFPTGRLVKHEAPDFLLIHQPRKIIGIELIQIHPLNHEDNGSSILDQKTGIEQILHAIHHKEEKIDHYRNPDVQHIWLIITAEDAPKEFTTKLRKYLFNHPIKSQFHKVYLFILMNRRIVDLLT